MARLIRLTAAHAGPTDGKVWMNADKIVKMDRGGDDRVTRIYHEPWTPAGDLDYTDVEETPQEVARMVNEPAEISLGANSLDVAINEWPRGRLSITS